MAPPLSAPLRRVAMLSEHGMATRTGGQILDARREQQRRYQEKLAHELGPDIRAALADPDVIEIMLNPDGRLWLERVGAEMVAIGVMNAAKAESIIATVAAGVGATTTYDNPVVECRLPGDGSRFAAMIPPGADAPLFTIRRRASRVFALADYVADGILSEAEADYLRHAVAQRRNILVAGGTGSGKTTLANALIAAIADVTPEHRLVIIEDTPEIQCISPNAIILRADEANPHLTMGRLIQRSMRHRPDRIIVGEVRGREALDAIKAWNTGHAGGVATIHANDANADDALDRLECLVAEAAAGDMRRLLAKAIDLIAVIIRDTAAPAGRRLKQLVQVDGFEGGGYRLTPLIGA